MTTFILIRHGMCDSVGVCIAGRKKGVFLNKNGKEEVEKLAEIIKQVPVKAVFTSPLERTVETANIIGKKINVEPVNCDELNEVDYGRWTGLKFSELYDDPLWKKFNNAKSTIAIPDGEMMLEVQARLCLFVEKKRRYIDGNVIIVSHGDPIKTVIANYAGIPLDMIQKFTINPASVTILKTDDYGAIINGVNCNADEIQDDSIQGSSQSWNN